MQSWEWPSLISNVKTCGQAYPPLAACAELAEVGVVRYEPGVD